VTPCVVCTMHEETDIVNLLVETQNQGRRFISDLISKPLGRFVSGLTLKPVTMVSLGLTLKPVASGFPVGASKSTAPVW
jgi:hypothetical protein